jgi:hypothetical protein
VHIHADLIAGLPGETLESFAAGFDRLIALRPQEIQVGILKRLRGTPIVRHDAEWGMRYSAHPPYEVLQTRLLDFATLQRLRRFARFWDLFGNSGNFGETLPLIWQDGSPFAGMMRLADWLHARGVRSHGIAKTRQYELLHDFLRTELKLDPASAAEPLARDYQRGGGSEHPAWLNGGKKQKRAVSDAMPKRQQRHLAARAAEV